VSSKSSITTSADLRESPALHVLSENRSTFLKFVRAFVRDLDEAEDIVQRASLKVLLKAAHLRENERAKAWIFRILRNEVADHFRRLAAQSKINQELSREIAAGTLNLSSAHSSRVCPCASHELTRLRENYSDALRVLEMNNETIASYADRKGISPNNAMVLLHRARKSLRARLQFHCGSCAGAGCFDCTCQN
jgi:RNA polymerase sigma-70 factor (ECF subfamily)